MGSDPTKQQLGFPGGSEGKESASNVGDLDSIPGWKDPLEGAWQLTSVFLPGKSQGQRSMAGNSPWGRKESDTTDWLSLQNSNSCGLSVQSQEYDKVGMGSPWDQKSFLSRESLCGWSWAC